MYYVIKETLVEVEFEDIARANKQYVAVLTPEEWENRKEQFQFGIDLEVQVEHDITKAEVNYDSLTGSFSIPNRENIAGARREFVFVLDEKGIVFIDTSGYVSEIISSIIRTKKWRFPCLERFMYDFMESTVHTDLKMLEGYEKRLDALENDILNENTDDIIEKLNDIRGDLIDLQTHYEQFIDLGQELEENENHFFEENNLRYFKLFTARLERYRDQVWALRDYSMQIRDLYQTQVDVKQNKIMAILTVITTLFFPLSIITGWYGMNFTHMPELEYEWSYPVLAGICVAIVLFEIWYFKKKKWM